MIHIRNISPEEVEEYWNLRLEALQTDPEAFGASYEESLATPLEVIKARIGTSKENYILGAYTEANALIGMLGFRRETTLKTQHKGFLWGMYVTPANRKQGIGKILIREAIERSMRLVCLEQTNLCVVTSNRKARELYLSLGFTIYGVEKNALKYDGKSYDEEYMTYRM